MIAGAGRGGDRSEGEPATSDAPKINKRIRSFPWVARHNITSASDCPDRHRTTRGRMGFPACPASRRNDKVTSILTFGAITSRRATCLPCARARAGPQSETSLHLVRVGVFFEMCGRIALLNQPAEGHKKRYCRDMRSCGRTGRDSTEERRKGKGKGIKIAPRSLAPQNALPIPSVVQSVHPECLTASAQPSRGRKLCRP